MSKPPYETGRVCIICDGLGDLICATVAEQLFKIRYPHHQLHLCTWGGIFAESQQHNSSLAGLYAVDGPPHVQYGHLKQAGFHPSEVVVLDNIVNHARFLDVATLSKINEQVKIDPHQLNYLVGEYNRTAIDWWWKTLASFNLDLIGGYCLQLCGELPLPDLVPKFYCGPDDYKYAETLADWAPYIVVNHTTGSNRALKEWPLSNWHALFNLILEKYPSLSILTVGNSHDTIIPIDSGHSKRVKHLRDTTIREVYPIVEKASFHICQQSGLGWLFGCTDTPGLQLNIGSDKVISGINKSNVAVVDQLKLFDPSTISISAVWDVLQPLLNSLGESR